MPGAFKLMDSLLQHYRPFENVAAFEKTGLATIDNALRYRGKSGRISLKADLERHVNKSDGTVLLNSVGPFDFGDEMMTPKLRRETSTVPNAKPLIIP